MRARDLGPDHRRLWAATALGGLGDGLLVVALPLLAAGITRQPLAVAGVLAAQRLPWLVVALAAPRWTAGIDRRTAMGLLRTLRAVTIGAVGAGQLAGVETLPLLYLGAAVAGAAELVVGDLTDEVATAGAPPSNRGRALGGLAVAGVVAHGLLGPPAGGFLFGTIAAAPFLLDALASSLAALLLLLLRGSGTVRPPAGGGPATAAAGQVVGGGVVGGGVVGGGAGADALAPLARVTALASAGASAGSGVLVLLALDVLGVSPLGVGMLLAAAAAGGIVGAWAAPDLGRVLGAGRALRASLGAAAAGHLLLAVAPAAWMAGLGLLLAGAGGGAALVLAAAVRHASRPGRAAAAHRRAHLLSWGAVPVGALLGGALAGGAGLRAPFVAAAAALAVAAALAGPAVPAARPGAEAVAGPPSLHPPTVRAGA